MDRLPTEAVGFFRYEGEGLAHGTVDARAGGLALVGINECIRHFAERKNPALQKHGYELPVRTHEGSWEVILLGVGTLFAGPYVIKAAQTMAANDFKDTGLKDAIRASAQALVYLVRLIKHKRGDVDLKKEKISWDMKREVALINNADGETLEIPAEFLKWYSSLPRSALKNVAYGVKEGVSLTIGAETSDRKYITTRITREERVLFGFPEEEEPGEFLFPELANGDEVLLQGRLTRGNEQTNSMGLEYHGHILNCVPQVGNVNRYKTLLFTECVVSGVISRFPRGGVRPERKPTVVISDIRQVAPSHVQDSLL